MAIKGKSVMKKSVISKPAVSVSTPKATVAPKAPIGRTAALGNFNNRSTPADTGLYKPPATITASQGPQQAQTPTGQVQTTPASQNFDDMYKSDKQGIGGALNPTNRNPNNTYDTGNYQGGTKIIQGMNPDNYKYSADPTTAEAERSNIDSYNANRILLERDNIKAKSNIQFDQNKSESTFKNGGDVADKYQAIQSQKNNGILDANQIAKNTGISIDEVNKFMQGNEYQLLQGENSNNYQQGQINQRTGNATQDVTLAKDRGTADLDKNYNRAKQKVTWQTDDIMRSFGENNQLARKMGASTGADKSTGYQSGMKALVDSMTRDLDRLNTTFSRETEDYKTNRSRIIQDYEINMDRIHQNHTNMTNELKMNTIAQYEMTNKNFDISSDNYTRGLQSIYTNYQENQNKINMQSMENIAAQAKFLQTQSDGLYQQINGQMDLRQKQIAYDTSMLNYQSDVNKYNQTNGIPQNNQSIPLANGSLDIASITEYCKSKSGDKVQCARLVNDYWTMATGSTAQIGNSFTDKVNAIKKVGQSQTPQVGGIFAYDVTSSQGQTGHTGIVTAVNADGSIEVLEANRVENSANGGVPQIGTYKNTDGFVFSNAPQGLDQGKDQDIINNYEPVFKNEGQTKSFEYANRMIPSVAIINKLEEGRLSTNTYQKLQSNKRAPDFLESTEYQQYDQARRDFVTATLRKESGATITSSEMDNAIKQYFVQPGDKTEVIAQKKKNRETALGGFIKTSGASGNQEYLNAVLQQELQANQNTTTNTASSTEEPKRRRQG